MRSLLLSIFTVLAAVLLFGRTASTVYAVSPTTEQSAILTAGEDRTQPSWDDIAQFTLPEANVSVSRIQSSPLGNFRRILNPQFTSSDVRLTVLPEHMAARAFTEHRGPLYHYGDQSLSRTYYILALRQILV